jgi:hypothetical protein
VSVSTVLLFTRTSIIDIIGLNADPTRQNIGGQLIVDGKYKFSDLDELIVNHIQALAHRVRELMAFEKFKLGPEDELCLYFLFSYCDVYLIIVPRSFLEKLCRGKPIKERIWVYSQSEAPWSLQPLLLG